MRKAICHYSFHRRWKSEGWTPLRLAEEVAALGVEGVDFHAGLLGGTEGAAGTIRDALARTGRVLSGLSLSNDFNQDDPAEFEKQMDTVEQWLAIGAEVGAPVMRVFGGHVQDRADPAGLASARGRVRDGLGRVAARAEELGMVLALENHGGLPCTAGEQVDMILAVGSPSLRATIDVGNYMSCGQEAHEGTALAAGVCAYVHFKDFAKITPSDNPWGWSLAPAIVGRGDVDHLACLRALKAVGYNGFVALEYEGADEESVGVPRSVAFMDEVMRGF